MTRSHALLHCPNAMLATARVEAWEGRYPSSIGVLLSSPRWEGRLLRYLELSGVARFVEVGIEEDEGHAARMARWIVWEAEEGARFEPGPVKAHQSPPSSFGFSLLSCLCKGDPHPENGAQHRLGAEDLFCMG
jgi:hypothetical protein